MMGREQGVSCHSDCQDSEERSARSMFRARFQSIRDRHDRFFFILSGTDAASKKIAVSFNV